MWAFDLTAAQIRDRARVLDTHHEVRVDVYLLGMDQSWSDDVSSLLVDGQVDVNVARGAEDDGSTHSATVTLQDPARSLGFVHDSPSHQSTAAQRILRIMYAVREPRVPGRPAPRWYETPVFTGPIVASARVGTQVSLEAVGKERLWRHVVHGTRTWRKGTNIRDVLTSMYGLAGEAAVNVALPPTGARLAADFALAWDDDLWDAAGKVADMAGWRMYFNGWGALIAKPVAASRRPVVTFDTSSNVVTMPEGGLNTNTNLVNRWIVNGPSPGGDKPGPLGYAPLPKAHPLSPWSLGRNGKAIAYDDVTTVDWAKTRKQAMDAAAARRHTFSTYDPLEIKFDGLAHPELEPGDRVRVQTSFWGQEFSLGEWSVPLRAGSAASYGANKRVSFLRQTGAAPVRRSARFRGGPRPRKVG